MTTGSRLSAPIFVVGAGRSGTTLMRSMLSAHPRIAIAPETHYMKLVASTPKGPDGTPADFPAFVESFIAHPRFPDLAIDSARFRQLVREDAAGGFRAVFSAALVAYRERVGKERVGEKTPGHMFFLEELFHWFPDARVVVMRRDPRAVVASQLPTPWVAQHVSPPSVRGGFFLRSRTGAVVEQAELWRRTYEDVAPRWQADPRVHVVAYETLVRDSERTLRSVCSFLQEDYYPGMVTSRADADIPEPASFGKDDWDRWRKEHHARSRGPVSDTSIDRWMTELSSAESILVEGICQNGMRSAGYTPSTSQLARFLGSLAARGIQSAASAEATARAVVHDVRRRNR